MLCPTAPAPSPGDSSAWSARASSGTGSRSQSTRPHSQTPPGIPWILPNGQAAGQAFSSTQGRALSDPPHPHFRPPAPQALPSAQSAAVEAWAGQTPGLPLVPAGRARPPRVFRFGPYVVPSHCTLFKAFQAPGDTGRSVKIGIKYGIPCLIMASTGEGGRLVFRSILGPRTTPSTDLWSTYDACCKRMAVWMGGWMAGCVADGWLGVWVSRKMGGCI